MINLTFPLYNILYTYFRQLRSKFMEELKEMCSSWVSGNAERAMVSCMPRKIPYCEFVFILADMWNVNNMFSKKPNAIWRNLHSKYFPKCEFTNKYDISFSQNTKMKSGNSSLGDNMQNKMRVWGPNFSCALRCPSLSPICIEIFLPITNIVIILLLIKKRGLLILIRYVTFINGIVIRYVKLINGLVCFDDAVMQMRSEIEIFKFFFRIPS